VTKKIIKDKLITMKVTEKEKKMIERKAKKYSKGNTSEFIRSSINSFLSDKEGKSDGSRTNS